jgi:hypothetical protein
MSDKSSLYVPWRSPLLCNSQLFRIRQSNNWISLQTTQIDLLAYHQPTFLVIRCQMTSPFRYSSVFNGESQKKQSRQALLLACLLPGWL